MYENIISIILGPTCRMATWDLTVNVEDLGPDAPPLKVSVTSDLHIGGVILNLVEKTRESPCVWDILHTAEKVLQCFLGCFRSD